MTSSPEVAPKPFPEASARRVLTMERLEGVPLTDLDAIKSGASRCVGETYYRVGGFGPGVAAGASAVTQNRPW